MKQEELQNLPTEALQKRARSLQVATGIMIGMVGLMAVLGIMISAREKGFSPFTILPVVFLPMIVVIAKNTKMVREELKRRNNEQ
jgi:hypothetical protein